MLMLLPILCLMTTAAVCDHYEDRKLPMGWEILRIVCLIWLIFHIIWEALS